MCTILREAWEQNQTCLFEREGTFDLHSSSSPTVRPIIRLMSHPTCQSSIYVRFFNLKRPFSPFNVVFEVTVLYYICIHKYLFRYRTYTISQDLQIDTAAIVPYLPSCNIMIFLVVCSLI